MKARPWIVVIVTVAAALLILYFATALECAPVERTSPPTSEVRNDPFMAIHEILAPDFPVTTYDAPADIDLWDCSYLILYARDLSYFESTELESWVKSGGRLQIVFDKPEQAPADDWWLEEGSWIQDLKPVFIYAEFESSELLSGFVDSNGALVGDSETRITVDQAVSFQNVEDKSDTTHIRARGQNFAVLRNIGNGFVLVAGRPYFMINQYLRKQDNVRFVSELFNGISFKDTGYIWIPSPGSKVPPKIANLNTLPVIVSIVLLCLLLFWSKLPRLGPTLPEDGADQRSLRERFMAEGRFLWRHGAGDSIIRTLRKTSQDLASDLNAKKTTPKQFIDIVAAEVESQSATTQSRSAGAARNKERK